MIFLVINFISVANNILQQSYTLFLITSYKKSIRKCSNEIDVRESNWGSKEKELYTSYLVFLDFFAV